MANEFPSKTLTRLLTFSKCVLRFSSSPLTSVLAELRRDMSSPGSCPPMDLIPVLKYLPSFFAPWKAACLEINSHRADLCSKWLYQVKVRRRKRLAHGEDEECFIEWMHLKEDLVS